MKELEKILEEIKTSSVYAETADKFGAMCVSVGTIDGIVDIVFSRNVRSENNIMDGRSA